jgi:hypothetical protein
MPFKLSTIQVLSSHAPPQERPIVAIVAAPSPRPRRPLLLPLAPERPSAHNLPPRPARAAFPRAAPAAQQARWQQQNLHPAPAPARCGGGRRQRVAADLVGASTHGLAAEATAARAADIATLAAKGAI